VLNRHRRGDGSQQSAHLVRRKYAPKKLKRNAGGANGDRIRISATVEKNGVPGLEIGLLPHAGGPWRRMASNDLKRKF
jgi:hypothetical protein